MKRILSLFIILVLMLSTLASCNLFSKPDDGGDNQTTTPPVEEANIQEAVDMLADMYEDLNNTSIVDGTNLAAQIKVKKTVFAIEWSSDNENVTFTYADGLCVVNIAKVTENVDYTITAKITSEGGQSAEYSINLVLAASFGMITEPEAGVAYKLALLHGNENDRQGAVVYFDGENYNGYAWYLNYTTDIMTSVDVYLEEVEGVEGGYRLYFNKNGEKTYIRAYPRDGDPARVTLELTTTVPTECYTFSTEYNTLIYTSTSGNQFYLGSSGIYKSISGSSISYITSATSYPCRLYGVGGIEETLPEQTLPTIPENYTSQDVVDALYQLQPGQLIDKTYEITGIVTSIDEAYTTQYNNISVVIVVEGREDKPVLLYHAESDGIVDISTIKVGDTVTARGPLTNYNGKFETSTGTIITAIVPGTGEVPTPPTPDKMSIPEVLASAEGDSVVVSGTVSEIYYAWSDEHNNMSFYISDDAGNKLLVFRTGTKVVVGDQVTVTGTATVYNGTIQIAQGSETVIDVPASAGDDTDLVPTVVTTPAVDTAYKFGMVQGNLDNAIYYLAGGMAQTYYLASTTSYSAAIDLYLENAEGGYYLYTMVNGVKTYVNMVVSGTHVNGAYESTPSTVYTWDATNNTIIANVTPDGGEAADYWFGTRNDKTYTTVGPCAVSYAGFYCQFYTLSEDTTGGEGGEGGESGEGGEVSNVITTIPDALAAADGAELEITGIVIIAESWSTQYNNMSVTIKDNDGNTLYVFRLGTQVGLGDTITVKGVVGSYNDTKQVAQGATATILVVHGDNHTYENGKCTVCEQNEPVEGEETIKLDFSTVSGTQYADETKTFGDYITVSTHNKGCHFNTQLRIYASDTNNGNAVITSTNVISSLVINAGYKAATLEVYGSTDGETWVLIENVSTSTSYANYTVDVDNAAGYKYIKLDATGAQIRIASIDVTIVK